jgi:hypothetical protein
MWCRRAHTMNGIHVDGETRYMEYLIYMSQGEYNNIVARFHNEGYTVGPARQLGDFHGPEGREFDLIAYQGIPIANEAKFAMKVVPNPLYKPLEVIYVGGREMAKQGPLMAAHIIQRKLTCRKKVDGYVLVETILPHPFTAHELNVDVNDQVLIKADDSLLEIQKDIIRHVRNRFNYKSNIKKLPHGRYDFDESGPIWKQRFKDFFSIRFYIETRKKTKRLITLMSYNKHLDEPANGEKVLKKKVLTSPFTVRSYKRYKTAIVNYIDNEVEMDVWEASDSSD